MKKIIRTNNLQKALEDYDALKGQAVSYVSVLPESPNIRNSVYCKQTTTDIEEGRTLTVGELIENFAQETETANHYVIPATYTITYSNDVVKGIVVSGDAAIMYEDEEFTTALATTFNLEDNYIFDVITHVTEMAYYMGDVTNQTLHPVVSFGVIAEVHAKIDRVERELDAKIDNNYNTLDTKIDNSYNTLDTKIDNEISNLAVNFTTNNLVANVATVNNAVIGNAQVNNFDVSSIIANGSTGSDGQVLGKVNGNVEWFSPAAIDTNDFKINYLTVNNGANVNGNNFKHKGFDVTSMTVISEADYNSLGWEYRNSALYMTTPNGNMYFHGIKYAATSMPKEYTAYVDLPSLANNMTTLTTSTLTFTSGAVTNSFVNGGAYNGIKERTPFVDDWNNSAPIGTQANTGSIITNANGLYITNASGMYADCWNLTDTFITNPSLITGAPVNYDPMKYCTDMSSMFYSCEKFNQPITIPNGVTNVANMFTYCTEFNQPLIIPNSVTNMSGFLMADEFDYPSSFNSPVTIGSGVTNMAGAFGECKKFNYPITIPNGVTDLNYTFGRCHKFNQPITIPNGVTNMGSTFYYCQMFNQPITIPNGVTNMGSTFGKCQMFNQPITIPNGVTNMEITFEGCANFNQPVTIPKSVTKLGRTFDYCNVLANSTVPIHISHEIALGDSSNYIYNMLVNGGCGITFAPSRILNDA